MPISQSPLVRNGAALVLGTIPIGFGINCIVNPQSALSFFELPYPTIQDQRSLIDALMVVYGVRDIFMGVAVWIAAAVGSTATMGWLTVAIAAVAGADGWVCKYMVGQGEMNHWGYAPMVGLAGLVFALGL